MKVLLLVHIEETFRKHFPSMMILAIQSAIRRSCYDRVIHFTSHVSDDSCVSELEGIIPLQLDWGWGFEPGILNDKENKWIVPSPSPHGWTWVHPVLREPEMRHAEIILGGGCDGECLLNMEAALDHLDLSYRKVRGFIYGPSETKLKCRQN